MAEQIRYSLIVWGMLQVLRGADAALAPRDVVPLVRERLRPTAHESETVKSGGVRWETVLGFVSGDAVTVGWMGKAGGWAITDAGREALDTYATPDELYQELYRRWQEIDERRKQALQSLSEVHQFIVTTLELVDAGNWTSHADLAELAGTSAEDVMYFLANASVKVPTSYRVLNADGFVPGEQVLHASYRGTDLRRLAREVAEAHLPDEAIDMPRLFEDFVTVALREALQAGYRGRVVGQPRHYLDVAGRVPLRPDIVWRAGGPPCGPSHT